MVSPAPTHPGEEIQMKVFSVFAALSVLALGSVNQASAQETKVRWFGHAAFSITTPRGKVMLRK